MEIALRGDSDQFVGSLDKCEDESGRESVKMAKVRPESESNWLL